VDTSAALNDRPADTAQAPAATTPAPTPQRRQTASRPSQPAPTRTERPAPTRNETPAAPAAPSLASGTAIATTTTEEISSHTNKVGDQISATVDQDVKNSAGKVVIPAGATVTYRITAIHESENKSDSTGTLTLAVSNVEFGGNTYNVDATPTHVTSQLQGRGTGAGDVAKVGAGAAAGAVVGRVLGGSTKGAVIGGIIGGAVGAQRAVETKDRDVVVPSGSKITITLNERFTASK
ncbi:MAG TPA: hypothetical protein VFL95_02105, partial [Gemmatimonadales bacterium]|nr:hypothetical protein [Gemmatimonadales bacterium]